MYGPCCISDAIYYYGDILDREQEIGSRLELLRKSQSLTQKQLAKITGVSQALISQVESGQKSLPTEAMWRLIREFGTAAESLVTAGTGAEYASNLIESWRQYDEAQRFTNSLLDDLFHAAEQLSPYQRAMESALPTAGEKKLLDAIIGSAARERYQRNSLPKKEDVAAFRHMPKGFSVDQITSEKWTRLLSQCVGLTTYDLDLLIQIATRLRTSAR